MSELSFVVVIDYIALVKLLRRASEGEPVDKILSELTGDQWSPGNDDDRPR